MNRKIRLMEGVNHHLGDAEIVNGEGDSSIPDVVNYGGRTFCLWPGAAFSAGDVIGVYRPAYVLDVATLAPDAPAAEDSRVKPMVERFLRWRLPDGFAPDNGISFTPPSPEHAAHWPSGTNLLDYSQAADMVRHMLDGLAKS